MSSDKKDDVSIVDASKEHQDDDERSDDGPSSEAAGIVRGISRSIRGVFRFPGIGRLPRQVVKQRLPVRRVAKVSDRLSTGLDVWYSAVDATAETRKSWRIRITSFLGCECMIARVGCVLWASVSLTNKPFLLLFHSLQNSRRKEYNTWSCSL